MASIQTSIDYMYGLMNRGVIYSMTYRNGPNSYDCSSSVYYALIAGGFFPSNIWIGNTESLFRDLPKYGWERYDVGQGSLATQRGDIFIWGVPGQTNGGAGHTGFFINPDDIIHCNYGYNGVHVNNHDWLSNINGGPYLTVFRYTGKEATQVPTVVGNPNDQELELGSTIKFDKSYRVDDLQLYNGVWQVRCNELCKAGFTWEDNGIPAEPLVEVDADGYATADQELAVGSRFVLPGKHKVLDLGLTQDMWLAEIELVGLKLWVDVLTATEISDIQPGTPVPIQKRVEQATPVTTIPKDTPKPVETPKDEPKEAPKEEPKQDSPSEITQPVEQPPASANNLRASFIRTAVPYILGLLVSLLTALNVDIPAGFIEALTGVLTFAIGTAYYVIARLLETKYPKLGILLGSSKQPVYTKEEPK